MNDMTKPPTPLFAIPKPLSEKIKTRNFGVVTMTAPPPSVIERVLGEASKDDAATESYYSLVAECATGAHGERFTRDLLKGLPGQCFGDWVDLRNAASRVCGLNREDIAKN